MIDIKATGKRIRELAREKGISAKEIQKEMGFTTTTPIYKWYNGQSIPSIDNLLILAELLDVKIEDILIKTEEGERKE